jgi:hypothetical protein
MKIKVMELYAIIVKNATKHGEDSDPDHEVGDLQDVIEECFNLMTESQITYLKQVLIDRELIPE